MALEQKNLKAEIAKRTNYFVESDEQKEFRANMEAIHNKYPKNVLKSNPELEKNKQAELHALETKKIEDLKQRLGNIPEFTNKLHAALNNSNERSNEITKELQNMGDRPTGMFSGKKQKIYDTNKVNLENEQHEIAQLMFSIKRLIPQYPPQSAGRRKSRRNRKSGARKTKRGGAKKRTRRNTKRGGKKRRNTKRNARK